MKHVYVIVIVPVTMLIPLSVGTLCKAYAHKYLKVIFQYLLFAAIIEITARILGARQINNLPLLHFYTVVEFLFILRLFQLILNNSLVTKIIRWLGMLFSLFCIFNFIFLQQILQFNSYPRPVAALIIISFSMFYFFRANGPEDQKTWTNVAANWIVTGLLVYFGSALFHFAFLNILYEEASLKVNYIFGTIHATLVMVMYLLFAIGFLYAKNDR